MLENKKTRKIVSLIMSVLMVLGCFSSNALGLNKVYAMQDIQLDLQDEKDLYQLASMKIESLVKDDLEKENLVEVMVYMNDQVDTQLIAYEAQKSPSVQAMTPYNAKLQVRKKIVEALRYKAEIAQNNIVKYLQQEMKKGNVEDFKSYTIVNMLYVKATKEVVENLSYMPEVEKIYKNKTHTLDSIKFDDEELNLQDIKLDAEGTEWNISKVRADEVWDLGFKGEGIVVANLDTGVQWDHPALKDKWRGYNSNTGATNSADSWFDPIYGSELPADSAQHGTHVMGTMVGSELDGQNQIGVAPGAKWIAARVFNDKEQTTDKWLLDAAEWILHPDGNPDNAPDVVNNSWGGSAVMDDYYRNAVIAWREAGIVPIFSAGNKKPNESTPWPGSISCPANYPESFAVAATDINDIRGSFSKLGPSPYDESIIKPNISAPGVNIRSAVPGSKYEGGWNGTSMAAPAVAGVVALMLSADASLTVDEIEEILQKTAKPLTDKTYKKSPNMGYGYGLVDAFAAVSEIAPGVGYISGVVLVDGEDLSEVFIDHQQNVFESYLGTNTDITAHIVDDIAVTEAELLVKEEGKNVWKVIPMKRVSGDHKDGIYKGTISSDEILNVNSIIYKIKAKDYAGNEVVTSADYKIDIKFGIIPDKYTQDFEEHATGWQYLGSKAWEIGVPINVGPKAYEGEKVVATLLSGNYPVNANSWLVCPPIDLRDKNLVDASLRFHEWYNMELLYDYGYVLVSNDDGETWNEAKPKITGKKETWSETIVNLNSYIGSPTPVFVAFRFTSNSSDVKEGWYIDNVRLVGTDNEAPKSVSNFNAKLGFRELRLSWDKSSEQDLSHYNLYRKEELSEEYIKIKETSDNKFVDTDVIIGKTYYYVLTAEDFSGNESVYTEVTALVKELPLLFISDFEDNNGGVTTGAAITGKENPWEWGVPTSGPMAAASGTKLWATNLTGAYPNNADAYLEIPSITIPSNKEAVLAFKHWVDMEITSKSILADYGQVLISNDDGATWQNITPVPGRYGSRVQSWQNETIILSGYSGETVKIRFYFHSNDGTAFNGWYIDDISISAMDYDAPEPFEYEEIVYDDGSVEDSMIWAKPGGGFAVLFTPEESCRVLGAKVYLQDENYPEPGGNRLGFVIYDSYRNSIGEPIYIDDLRRGAWNYIDLSSFDFTTSNQFYISTMQDLHGEISPALGFDINPSSEGWRTYANLAGEFSQWNGEAGMIRALVSYDKIEGSAVTDREIKEIKEISVFNYNINSETEEKDYKTITDSEVQNITMSLVGVPAQESTVTIKETGKTVKVDPITGKFFMRADNGTYTLVAEAYGHYSKEQKITVVQGENTNYNFTLETVPQGTITGKVFDRFYNTPAANAVIRIVEDLRISPVTSDKDGNFTIQGVYEGEYTLKVKADGFNIGEVKVTVIGNKIVTSDIGLKKFVGYDTEIAYDDGTAENGLVAVDALTGWAVRFTPVQYGKVVGANIFMWYSTFPDPGGVRIGFTVYGLNLKGEPYQVAPPIFQDVVRGQWNFIDLSSFGLTTDEDFYISTIQDRTGNNSPAIGIDNGLGEEYSDRSYKNLFGEFKPMKDEDVSGGLMIRAIMEYSIDTPVITNLQSDINYTNQDKITVSGRIATDGKVKIYVNDTEAIVVNSKNKEFSAEVDLTAEQNFIRVSAELNGVETEVSEPILVIKDKKAPILIVESPINNAKLNVELANVIGNVADNSGIAKLEVNGKAVVVEENGYFYEKVLLNKGTNVITIKATDFAGNVTTVVRTVISDIDAPAIKNITPSSDVVLGEGETLTVSFNATAGGSGYFRLVSADIKDIQVPMTESNGTYTGNWIVENGMPATELSIELVYISPQGSEVTAMATGKVIIVEDGEIPVKGMEKLPSNTVILGSEAFDINYLNRDASAQAKLIKYLNSNQEVYIKVNETIIVTIAGRIVTIDNLAKVITYYDADGNVSYFKK